MLNYNAFSRTVKMILPLFALVVIVSTGCQRDDDDGNHNEEELITSVLLTFIDSNGASSTFSFKDTDGSGGADPVVQDISLKAGKNYTVAVQFLDESNAADVHDITLEVAQENTEHLVCFETEGNLSTPEATDTDTNGKPLGLINSLTTGTTGTGKLTIRLKHQPDKNNIIPCETGDTDVEATFDVAIN